MSAAPDPSGSLPTTSTSKVKFGDAVLEAAEQVWFRRAVIARNHRRFLGVAVGCVVACLLVGAQTAPLVRLRRGSVDVKVGLWDVSVEHAGTNSTTGTVCGYGDRVAQADMCRAMGATRGFLILAILAAAGTFLWSFEPVDPGPFIRPGQFTQLKWTFGLPLHWADFVLPGATGFFGVLALGVFLGRGWNPLIDALKAEHFGSGDRVWVTVDSGWWLFGLGVIWPVVILATRLLLPDLDTDAWLFVDTSTWRENRPPSHIAAVQPEIRGGSLPAIAEDIPPAFDEPPLVMAPVKAKRNQIVPV